MLFNTIQTIQDVLVDFQTGDSVCNVLLSPAEVATVGDTLYEMATRYEAQGDRMRALLPNLAILGLGVLSEILLNEDTRAVAKQMENGLPSGREFRVVVTPESPVFGVPPQVSFGDAMQTSPFMTPLNRLQDNYVDTCKPCCITTVDEDDEPVVCGVGCGPECCGVERMPKVIPDVRKPTKKKRKPARSILRGTRKKAVKKTAKKTTKRRTKR
jgi:hypothetical protein